MKNQLIDYLKYSTLLLPEDTTKILKKSNLQIVELYPVDRPLKWLAQEISQELSSELGLKEHEDLKKIEKIFRKYIAKEEEFLNQQKKVLLDICTAY
jgi:hypothetical protein